MFSINASAEVAYGEDLESRGTYAVSTGDLAEYANIMRATNVETQVTKDYHIEAVEFLGDELILIAMVHEESGETVVLKFEK